MGELSQLPNIGPVVEKQLNAAGIQTGEELCALGAREAWLRIQAFDPSACIHRLLALEGLCAACQRLRFRQMCARELKAFYLAHRVCTK